MAAEKHLFKTTLSNSTKGWKVGDPINNLTSKGNIPKWSTIRQRFWKNEAHYYSHNYTPAELGRMQKGLAPQRFNTDLGIWQSKELHHIPAQRYGGLFDVVPLWPEEHAILDPSRFLKGG